MPKKLYISDDEKNQFRDAVKGIKPLSQDKHHHPKTNDKQQPHTPPSKSNNKLPSYSDFSMNELDQLADDQWVGGEDKVHFVRPALQHDLIQKMRKGKINIESRLDLHHMTVTETLIAVDRLILTSKNRIKLWLVLCMAKVTAHQKENLFSKTYSINGYAKILTYLLFTPHSQKMAVLVLFIF